MKHSNKIDSILSIGIPLEDIGVKNWALNKENALTAIEKLEVEDTPILGGDVYELVNNKLQMNYDNWFCDKLANESKSEFLSRSILKAKNYINNHNKVEAQIYFVLVPDND